MTKEDYSLIPERIMSNLLQYVAGKEAPGGFLYAVLTNDLFAAIGRADKQMKPLIPLLAQYIYWEIPAGCWGSPEIVKAWMAKEGKINE